MVYPAIRSVCVEPLLVKIVQDIQREFYHLIVKREAVMVDSSHPIDMSNKDYFIPSTPSPPGVSPPPLTKIEKKKPSSPREFFAKLYGPDKQMIVTMNPLLPLKIFLL